jgi:hypothetical protein
MEPVLIGLLFQPVLLQLLKNVVIRMVVGAQITWIQSLKNASLALVLLPLSKSSVTSHVAVMTAHLSVLQLLPSAAHLTVAGVHTIWIPLVVNA